MADDLQPSTSAIISEATNPLIEKNVVPDTKLLSPETEPGKDYIDSCAELELYRKRFLKCLVFTMLVELVIFAIVITSVARTPWYHSCHLYTIESYTMMHRFNPKEKIAQKPTGTDFKHHPSFCKQSSQVAWCVVEKDHIYPKNATEEQEDTSTPLRETKCQCTKMFDHTSIWDKSLSYHDSISKQDIAWTGRGLLLTAAFLKFTTIAQYIVCLFSQKLRSNPYSYIIKFSSSWLCGALLLGSSRHIITSDYTKMCEHFGVGFYAFIVSLFMTFPSLFGVVTSTGYYIHIRCLNLELKKK